MNTPISRRSKRRSSHAATTTSTPSASVNAVVEVNKNSASAISDKADSVP